MRNGPVAGGAPQKLAIRCRGMVLVDKEKAIHEARQSQARPRTPWFIAENELSSNSSERADQLLDSCLEQFGSLLSEPANTAIQASSDSSNQLEGPVRRYFRSIHDDSMPVEELLNELNLYLGGVVQMTSPAQQTLALEALFTLPSTELNCRAGMKERMQMMMQKIRANGNLTRILHQKVLQKITIQDDLGRSGVMAVHNVSALERQLLSDSHQRYASVMQEAIEDELTGQTKDLLTQLDRVIENSSTADVQYNRLRRFAENYKQDISMFFPPALGEGSAPSEAEIAELDTFICQRRYFGEPHPDTYRFTRVNHDQVYGDLLTKLKGFMTDESKLLLILSNPHMAAGLARGLLDADTRCFFDIQPSDLQLNEEGYVASEDNHKLIDKLSSRLLEFCETKEIHIQSFLVHDSIDLQSGLSCAEHKQCLGRILHSNPKLAEQFLIRAVMQGLSGESYQSILDVCNPHLTAKFKIFLNEHRTYLGNLRLPDDPNTPATVKSDQLTHFISALKMLRHMPPALMDELQTTAAVTKGIPILVSDVEASAHVHVCLIDTIRSESISSEKREMLFHAVLDYMAKNKGADRQTNAFFCQVIQALGKYVKDNPNAETNLSLIKALTTAMSALHAATFRKSATGFVTGKLLASQDPQTKAYKLVKKYLNANIKSPDKANDLLKHMWSGDTLQTLSQNTRTLSKAHWKKVATSIITNALLYGSGSGIAGEVIANAADALDHPNFLLDYIDEKYGTLEELIAQVAELDAQNLLLKEELLDAFENGVDGDTNVALYQRELLDQIELSDPYAHWDEKPSEFLVIDPSEEYYSSNSYNILDYDNGLAYIERDNLSEGAKLYYDQLLARYNPYAANALELNDASTGLDYSQEYTADVNEAQARLDDAQNGRFIAPAIIEGASAALLGLKRGAGSVRDELKT